MPKIIAVYHKDCNDGTSSAAALQKKFPEAELFPLNHDYKPEDIAPILEKIDQDTLVYTLDCCLGVREFLAKGIKVITLDHHTGVRETFENLSRENPNYTFIFDNDKSGASLTWSYFFPEEEMPELIKYVEDSDLWRYKYGDETKYVTKYLSMYLNDPESVGKLFGQDLSEIKERGKIILAYSDKELENLIKTEPITIKIGEHNVFAFNITSQVSISAHKLSQKLAQAVVLFMIKGQFVKMSFRSDNTQSPSALDLAQILGGNGHRNSSGAVVSLQLFLSMIER